jgi:benzoate transport
MGKDPQAIIDSSPMSRLQIGAIATTIGLNALDGFDVLSISFASPGISKEWGIDRASLGAVLSMELFGMAIGSVFLGGLADKIGRRPTILGCLAIMTLGMYMVTLSGSIADLMIWRVLTGLGIGGMLAAINAVTAELSNAKKRNVCMALMVIGYPLGAVIGGTIAAMLLKGGDWRVVFEFGAMVTLVFVPLVWFLVPETPAYLATKRPAGALETINATLKKFKLAVIDALPALSPKQKKHSIADVLKPALLPTTLLVTLAYFAHMVTFYFILKWVPKIVVDMGFEPSAAAGVLVWANVGGALGGALFGLLIASFGLKRLTIGVLLTTFLMINYFGRGQSDLATLSMVVGIAGFFSNSAIVGLYTIFAAAYPTHVRATGTGFAIGVGRAGAAIAPLLAGILFQTGYGLQAVATVMAMGSLIAAIALTFLKLHEAKSVGSAA